MSKPPYSLQQQPLQDYDGFSLIFCGEDDCSLTWQEVLQGWQHNPDFQNFFSTTLAAVPYAAYFWETSPLNQTQQHAPFTCVVINSPALARAKADYGPFSTYLKASVQSSDIRVFSNLGGDAQLIAPCPVGSNPDYPHLAAFLRQAPASLKGELWATLAGAIQAQLDYQPDQPLWVSTSGLGVFWLHVRLDRVPKYYQYAPFRQSAQPGF
jgi:hypothetical protein